MKKYIIFLLPFVLISCATTNISSFRNPDVDFSNYKKIAVYGNSRDIDFRKTLENDLVNSFNSKNIDAVSIITVLSPVKEYTNEEISRIMNENEIDALLSVEVISVSEETAYVPQTTTTTYQSQYVGGQYVSVPHTTTSGGYSISRPRARFEIILTDIQSDETAFKATANSAGDEFSDMKTISKSLSEKIVEEYISISSR